jgi:hypothetical protein
VTEPESETESDAKKDEPAKAAAPERVDEEGLPIDRPATLDDVRGGEGSGRTIAVGCSVLVASAILGFWLLRAYLFG